MNRQNVFCTERWNRPTPRIKAVPDVNHAWTVFKSHLITLEDQIMQDRINFLVISAVAITSTSRSIISQFGFPTSGIKPFYFKDMTRGNIDFHSRTDRNHTDLLYDICGGGYICWSTILCHWFQQWTICVNLRMINSIKIGYSLSWASKGAPQVQQVVCWSLWALICSFADPVNKQPLTSHTNTMSSWTVRLCWLRPNFEVIPGHKNTGMLVSDFRVWQYVSSVTTYW